MDCLIFQRLMGQKFRGITCMINLLTFVVDVNGSKFMDERITKFIKIEPSRILIILQYLLMFSFTTLS